VRVDVAMTLGDNTAILVSLAGVKSHVAV